MKKKLINGKTVWVKEEGDEVVDTVVDGEDTTDTEADVTTDNTEVDAEAKRMGKTMAEAIMAELGIGTHAKKSADRYIDQPQNAKLKSILNGKDIFTQKDELTAKEKIVGFFHALVTGDNVAAKALSEGTAADGGYLFPNEFRAELIKQIDAPGTVRNLVKVIPMRRDIMELPTLNNKPKVYATAENAAKTTTTAAFGQKTLTARKFAAIMYSSDELIEDSTEFDVVQLIIGEFADAISRKENEVLLRGNGTTEPTGLFTSTDITEVTNTDSATLADNLIDLEYALPIQYRANAIWVAHPNRIKDLRKAKDDQGQYLWQPSLQAGEPPRFAGYPVHQFYDCPQDEILFGDLKTAYYLGDRQSMAVKISQDTTQAFTQDQTAIRVVFRIAGEVVQPAAARRLASIPGS